MVFAFCRVHTVLALRSQTGGASKRMNKIITKYRAMDGCRPQGMKNHSPNYHFLFRCDDSPSMLAVCYTPAA